MGAGAFCAVAMALLEGIDALSAAWHPALEQ
jgi:hypothetical protein